MTAGQAPARAIRVDRSIAAPSAHLWSVISSPGYLERCHPFCAANPVARWPGTGSHDIIYYYSGRVVHRRLLTWDDGIGYDLRVTTPDGIPQAQVRWQIDELGEGQSRLMVTLQPLFSDHLPVAIRSLAYVMAGRPMRKYLAAVVAGVAYHAETGEQVARNQFGPPRWFSPRAS